jgi:hypothetical protein
MQKILLLLLNVIFGSLVLWSYYSGVTKNPDLSLKLWGGVPEILRNYIVGFMFISAIGYFFFTYNFLVNVDLKNTIFLERFPSWSLHIVYLLILIPSSLWMDLTFRYMNSGSNLDWIYVISALYCVALSSIFLLLFIIDSGDPEKKFIYLASFIGGGCFVFHTLFLDGLIWTIFFHKKL